MAAPMTDSWVLSCDTLLFSCKLLFCFYFTLCIFTYIFKIYEGIKPCDGIIPCGSKIVLITAHPDDECMFFSPALIYLSRTSTVHLLCTTSGNYYGQGAVRKKEILESCEILGIKKENVEVLDDDSFPDDPKISWDLERLKARMEIFIHKIQPDYILTFDEQGVSGHSNHISVSQTIKRIDSKKGFRKKAPKLFQLETVNLFRKYSSILDIPITLLGQQVTYISSFSDIFKAQRAMYAHKSQFVWFRVLYIIFSRYMVINTFVEVDS